MAPWSQKRPSSSWWCSSLSMIESVYMCVKALRFDHALLWLPSFTDVHCYMLRHLRFVSLVSWFYQDEDIRRRCQLWLVTASEYRQHSGRRHRWWYSGRRRLHRREAATCEGPGEIPSEQTLEVDQSPSRFVLWDLILPSCISTNCWYVTYAVKTYQNLELSWVKMRYRVLEWVG